MTIEMTNTASTLPLVETAGATYQRLELPARIQASYTTRFVARAVEADRAGFHLAAGPTVTPKAGDVVVARVTEILNHKRVETPESRKAILFPGALIMLAYGHRYAADQFLAHVPDSLEPCHLVAAGGVAGMVTEQHVSVDDPTRIEPLGLLADDLGVVNLTRFAPYALNPVPPLGAAATELAGTLPGRPTVIGVLGTSMNSGKSTAMATLVNGLTNAGLTVSAGKSTGTGAGNDPMIYRDGGAAKVLDFTDFGYPTTFRLDFEQVRALTVNVIDALSGTDTDVVVVEIADGVYQGETARLLRDPLFHAVVDRIVFAAGDALGAVAGVGELQAAGLDVAAVSGVLTSSPLATAEARAVLSVPVIDTYALTGAAVSTALLPQH
ncbi:DUF1611 domain-containing protein [Citricoccus sp.]|uniref:DUF1611 domain-containing protein n=1 Tax=Citricoccus sp. TaxID=1978372 RepID=UPI0026180A84|nr:DUF1611 domain-containing protein [Citricoccus sp.]HRO31366.1 DUF1611 domain-containing protein [Citricoccus sp.]HRO94682.1 DUF1611 domain-containing protein [Citricoccus sp.]